MALLRAATGGICLRFGLVDRYCAPTNFSAMQARDRLFSVSVGRHFNETKPL